MTTETILVKSVHYAPTAKGKPCWIATTDRGQYSIWEKELADDLSKSLGSTFEAKISVSDKWGNSIKDVALMRKAEFQPVEVPKASGFESAPDWNAIEARKSLDIHRQVAFKKACDSWIAGKIEFAEIGVKALALFEILELMTQKQ